MDEFFKPESQEISRKVVEYYHSAIKDKPKILRFLQKQGITASELEKFKIGSSKGKLSLLVASDGVLREKMRNLGFFSRKGREVMIGHVTFPVMDAAGMIHDVIGYKYKFFPEREKNRIVYLQEKPVLTVKEEKVSAVIAELKAFRLKEIVSPKVGHSERPEKTEKVVEEDDLIFQYGKRTYRVRGLSGYNPASLRVNLKISQDAINYRDTADLYVGRFREKLINQISEIFEEDKAVISREIETLIEELEKIRVRRDPSRKIELSPEEKAEAVNFLKSPNLAKTISEDLARAGLAGEEKNRLMLYMAFTSRKLRKPLSVVVKGDSAGGKSYLVGQILKFFPEEDIKNFTEITEKSLYYMPEDELAHKVLVIFERHGSEASDYSIRSLQSEECLRIAVTMKDGKTGEFRTVEKKVRGPISYVETTTRLSIHPENASRMFDLFTDESEAQTDRIYRVQNLEYLPEKKISNGEAERLLRRHQNFQRVLEPVSVKIPYVELIEFPVNKLRLRRDRMRFLALIETFTFLHQYQRTRETVNGIEYVVADLQDYRMAYDLAAGIMKDTLSVIHPKSRELLSKIREIPVKEFSISDIESASGWHSLKIRRYIRQLIEEDYLEQKQGGNKGKRAIYGLCSNKEAVAEKLEGLPDPETLERQVVQLFKGHDKQVKPEKIKATG